MKFAKDRQRWMQWLFEAKKRFGLVILNYVVTSNHVHLLIYDKDGSGTIPRSIQLLAGRTGQEYNQRKKRSGAFWGGRYHATAIETGAHLLRCIVYVDLNMVRAGVVKHPKDWAHGGYKEIQHPRRRNIIIDYEILGLLSGFSSFIEFQSKHREWVQTAISRNQIERNATWTQSIANGSETFVSSVKDQMGGLAIGREVINKNVNFELRESVSTYKSLFDVKKSDIEGNNLYYWR